MSLSKFLSSHGQVEVRALLVGVMVALTAAVPARAGVEKPMATKGFFDPLDTFDGSRWERSHGWSNGVGYGCGWQNDHVRFEDGTIALVLDRTPDRRTQISCGEFRTHDYHHFGRYEVSMRAARGDGIISAFFIYTGPPFGDPWHETTIEILGRDPTKVEFTLFIDGVPNGTIVDLGFDASEDLHTYAIDWAPDAIRWYVDGKLLHEDLASERTLPTAPGRIFANIWNNDGLRDLVTWSGRYPDDAAPAVATLDWIRFTPMEAR
jgi:beta-glucanase (GH16 family)